MARDRDGKLEMTDDGYSPSIRKLDEGSRDGAGMSACTSNRTVGSR